MLASAGVSTRHDHKHAGIATRNAHQSLAANTALASPAGGGHGDGVIGGNVHRHLVADIPTATASCGHGPPYAGADTAKPPVQHPASPAGVSSSGPSSQAPLAAAPATAGDGDAPSAEADVLGVGDSLAGGPVTRPGPAAVSTSAASTRGPTSQPDTRSVYPAADTAAAAAGGVREGSQDASLGRGQAAAEMGQGRSWREESSREWGWEARGMRAPREFRV